MVSVERAMQYVSGVPREVDGHSIVSSPFVFSCESCLTHIAGLKHYRIVVISRNVDRV